MIRGSLISVSALILLGTACKTRDFNVDSKKVSEQDKIQGNECLRQLAKWENEANGVSKRASTLLKLKNYEIPLELIESDVAESTPKEIKDAFFFEKDGKKFVRWIVQQEDTKWFTEVETFLEKKTGKKPVQQEYFNGYLTASRSMLVIDPATGYSFSLKASTNKTGGNWKDKKQDWKDGQDIRAVSDYVARLEKNLKLKNAVILQEPMAFGIADIDQSNVVRLVGEVATCDKYYLPGFSALHEQVGKELAGKENPVEFWNEYYVKPLGRALAEFAGIWGLSFDSPHSQNFLIELDKQKKPTGRVILRDLGDVFVLKEQSDLFAAQNVATRLAAAENLLNGRLSIAVGLLHGNVPPSWVRPEQYANIWGPAFFENFEKEYTTLTGFDVSKIGSPMGMQSQFSYVSKVYTVDQNWKTAMNTFASCVKTRKADKGSCPQGVTERQR
ncbi:MAG: hypothetical protein FJY29_04435 [Betaproteobacteria bacterium]|nr:hypothetical protein [Betaproteobacteria bacterium]